MKSFKLLMRIITVVSLLSISAFSVTLDTDTFEVNLEDWSGTNVSRTGGANKVMNIPNQDTASKLFSYPTYANQGVTLSFTVATNAFESDDTIQVTVNGQTVYNSGTVGTLTFNGWLNASGELSVSIKSNSNNSAEYVTIDDVNLSTGLSYTVDNWRPFSIVNYSGEHNTKGDITVIGNSVMLKKDGSGSTCPNATERNNAITATYADIDANASTFNSTSANLSLPATATGKEIVWAGLYWQGYLVDQNDTNKTNAKSVLFKTPTASDYVSLTSESSKFNWIHVTGSAYDRFYYQGVADVTAMVKAAGEGTYSVANVYSNTLEQYNSTQLNTLGGAFGAWSIVIVYKDSNTTLKNLSVYDGYVSIGTVGASTIGPVFSEYDVLLSGFLTPTTGAVNSNFLVFAGEGDAGTGTGDYTKLTSGGTTNFVSLYNPLNPADNIYNASVTDGGTAVTSRDPDCSNTIGIDIDKFAVGSNALAGTQGQIIQNSQTQTKVRLNSTGDGYFPGVFAFSTDLYEPDVCYVENIFKGTTNISGIGAQVNADENLTVRVYVKNKGTEAASGVSILHQFDSSFPYAVNSANYNNSNPAYEIVMPPLYTRTTATDSAGNDLYEYNSTSLLSKINLGAGATSSSGGTFNPTTTTAVFEYSATVKILDSNYSNVYKAGYINSVLGIDYTNNPVTIFSCDGSKNSFYGYSSPVSVTGDYNVVYASNANGALSSGYNYNLPTAIASRADNYKVIALNTGTDILKDINTTVAVELVDASSGTCSTHTPISDVKTWIPFKNVSTANFSAADIINGVILADSQAAVKFYQKAGKNVKFRVSYPHDGSGGAIIMSETVPNKFHLTNFPSYAGNSCYAEFNATTYNPANGNIQGEHTYSQVPEACANAGEAGASAMTQHEVNVCLECIYGSRVNYVCSKDNFAIRPEAFYVKLSDQNQTNFVTKQVMSNNISGAVSLNLASGYQYYAEVNATNHVDSNATSGYTTTEGLDSIWNPVGVIETECNDDSNKSSALNFVNGLVEANLSVDQVGIYALNVTDDTWTDVDSNVSTMTHHTSPFFLSGTDCILNSAVTNSLGTHSGCNISSNHVNSDAGITYIDTIVRYRPYDFNLTSIQMSRGKNFAGTIMGQNAWTYMNSVNVDENMSVRYFGPIRPVGKTGTLLSNYVNDCYAQPVNMDLNLTFPITAGLPNWRYRLQEVNATTVWRDSNAIITTPSTNVSFPLVTIPQTSFLKNQNGLADMNLSLNFDRNQTLSVNPITVGLQNFQIKCQVPGDCSTRADFSTTHLPDANVTTDNNTTFVYGRIIPRNVRTFGTGAFTANAWYEVFGTTVIGTTALPISKNDPAWSTNTLHGDANDGDGNVTVVITGANPANAAAVNGVETYTFGAGYALGGYKAHINTDPWLWYGMNALSYLDPVNATNLDCLTHPCFNINVVPAVGATGSAKSTNTATKASKRSTEGGGTWKSTKDYAPAIR